MFVRLSRERSGQEVVKAFKAATTFSTFSGGEEIQWRPEEFADDFQYEPGSVKQTIRSIGVNVWSFYFKRKWVLFGEKIWKQNLNTKFTLSPLVLSQVYSLINVDVFKYSFDNDYTTIDPKNPQFDNVRLPFERMIEKFYVQLLT